MKDPLCMDKPRYYRYHGVVVRVYKGVVEAPGIKLVGAQDATSGTGRGFPKLPKMYRARMRKISEERRAENGVA